MALSTIKIFDTTLRDGEQTPGVCLQVEEKLEIARALAKLRVDVIEAGFPISSLGDFNAVNKIAANVKEPIIAALARTNRKDIEVAAEALKKAERPRIHTFIATSDLHMKYKLKMNREQVLILTEEAVRYAKKFVKDVEFCAEDASRSNWEFLCKVYTVAIAAGANVINVTDTVGYITPAEFGNFIKYIRDNVPNIDRAIISVHCHDDLGMSVANSLSGIMSGAEQVECTINGLGERAGNTAMEELVMALRTRRDYYKAATKIDTKQIYQCSQLVSKLSGIMVPPNKAIVGNNAFAHSSGIHQHGVLNNVLTYEIMHPETIGIGQNVFVLGKHSGRHALEAKLSQLGYNFNKETISEIFKKFKCMADSKKVVSNEDIEKLLAPNIKVN